MNINKIIMLTFLSFGFIVPDITQAAAAFDSGGDFFSKRLVGATAAVLEDAYSSHESSRKKYSLDWDSGSNASQQGKLVISRGGGYTVIAYGGIGFEDENIADGTAEKNFGSMTDIEDLEGFSKYSGGGQCASGYAEIFSATEDKVKSALIGGSGGKFIFAGHGLGGAVAQIAALYASEKVSSATGRTGVITFGSPAVFDAEGAAAFSRIYSRRNLVRYEIKGDPVPAWKADSSLVQAGSSSVLTVKAYSPGMFEGADSKKRKGRMAHVMSSYSHEFK